MRARLLAARIGLVYLAVNAALLGLWASLAPRSWFDNFPGAGHNWASQEAESETEERLRGVTFFSKKTPRIRTSNPGTDTLRAACDR